MKIKDILKISFNYFRKEGVKLYLFNGKPALIHRNGEGEHFIVGCIYSSYKEFKKAAADSKFDGAVARVTDVLYRLSPEEYKLLKKEPDGTGLLAYKDKLYVIDATSFEGDRDVINAHALADETYEHFVYEICPSCGTIVLVVDEEGSFCPTCNSLVKRKFCV